MKYRIMLIYFWMLHAFASGAPVFDLVNWIQNGRLLATQISEYKTQVDQYKNQLDQYQNMLVLICTHKGPFELHYKGTTQFAEERDHLICT